MVFALLVVPSRAETKMGRNIYSYLHFHCFSICKKCTTFQKHIKREHLLQQVGSSTSDLKWNIYKPEQDTRETLCRVKRWNFVQASQVQQAWENATRVCYHAGFLPITGTSVRFQERCGGIVVVTNCEMQWKVVCDGLSKNVQRGSSSPVDTTAR